MFKKGAWFLFIFLGLVLSGCGVSVKTKDTSGVDGGLFVSQNKGQIWGQSVAYPTVKGVESIRGLDNSILELDPSDSNAVYFGSPQGLYYSYDLAYGWQKATKLPGGYISSVAVSPGDKCTVYVTIGNKLFVTKDCHRSYEQLYYDNDPQTELTTVSVDHHDVQKVFIGTSKGDVLKSTDSGKTWRTVLRSGYRVLKFQFSPKDSRVAFLSTNGNGMYKTSDNGENWDLLKDKMKDIKNSNKVVDFHLSPAEDGLIFAATAVGISKSTDGGETWAKIELITSEKDAVISSLGVNPKDPKEIYYATRTTFYSSFDGGVSWSAKKMPSTRGGHKIVVRPDQPNIVYMTVRSYKK
jgi:photosystem II stability/assembly factor-like uncharacterized protein